MITFVPFDDLTEQHLEWIVESALVPPPEVRVEASDFLRGLWQQTMSLFAWEDGCVIVGIRDNRLIMFAFCCHNLIKRLPDLLTDMKRLAADWSCDAIETTCFNRTLSSAIKKVGAETESEVLVLRVE